MAKEDFLAVVPIKKASELSGLTPHMITYLGRIEVLVPAGSEPGRGRRRLFTFADVLFLKLIADFLARGIEVKRLGEGLRRAKADAESWLDITKKPRRFLVTDGTEVMVRSKGTLESKTMNGQLVFAFVLDMAFAHASLKEKWPQAGRRRA